MRQVSGEEVKVKRSAQRRTDVAEEGFYRWGFFVLFAV